MHIWILQLFIAFRVTAQRVCSLRSNCFTISSFSLGAIILDFELLVWTLPDRLMYFFDLIAILATDNV